MKALRRLSFVVAFVITTSAALVWRVSAKIEATEEVDFVYFGEESKEDIEVPFGLLGSCKQNGVSIFALDGVVINDVRADGVQVEPLRLSGIHTHPGQRILVKRPGSSFGYSMKLADLTSIAPGGTGGTAFRIPKGDLPGRIEISYRIRCADGVLAGPFRTVGQKYSVPRGEGIIPKPK